MFIRYFSSAGIGIVVTTALLWTMNTLIDLGSPVQTVPRTPHFLDWIRVRADTEVQTIVEPPQRVKEAKEPPQLTPPADPTGETIPVGVPVSSIAPTNPDFATGTLGNVDSGLINIINARPDYPIVASQKGLEGFVVVQFDVTEIGTVENVTVVESSSSVFNKSAIKAAYRSKYKPKTVDGVSQRTLGLRKLFRFEMET